MPRLGTAARMMAEREGIDCTGKMDLEEYDEILGKDGPRGRLPLVKRINTCRIARTHGVNLGKKKGRPGCRKSKKVSGRRGRIPGGTSLKGVCSPPGAPLKKARKEEGAAP